MVREPRGPALLVIRGLREPRGMTMCKIDIDRICIATLLGRFGPRVMSPRAIQEFTCASSRSRDAIVTIRDAAVWTTARSGIEQGKH